MRTRDVLRWNVSPTGMAELALFVVGCGALALLSTACDKLERWLDQ